MIRVDVLLPDPAGALAAGAFGAGALIRIERSDLVLGVYGAYAEVQTTAIVSGTVSYQWWDSAGVDTSLYRYRLSNAGATVLSDYSQAFSGVNPAGSLMPATTYATLGQALALYQTPITDPRLLQRIASNLATATDEIIGEFDGRDYFRHPASGDAVTYADGSGDRVLHLHDGIISVTTLEVSLDLGQTYATVPSGEYWLVGQDPASSEPIPTGEPYFHIVLRPFGTFYVFPPGRRTVRITGARGWPSITPALVEGCAARARQLAFADASYTGSIPGDPEYAAGGSTSERFPQVLYRFMQGERERFWCRV